MLHDDEVPLSRDGDADADGGWGCILQLPIPTWLATKININDTKLLSLAA